MNLTKQNGLFEAICELYGQDPNCSPEDVVEAAWKAVPRYIGKESKKMSEDRMTSADAIDQEILSDLANGVKFESTDKMVTIRR